MHRPLMGRGSRGSQHPRANERPLTATGTRLARGRNVLANRLPVGWPCFLVAAVGHWGVGKLPRPRASPRDWGESGLRCSSWDRQLKGDRREARLYMQRVSIGRDELLRRVGAISLCTISSSASLYMTELRPLKSTLHISWAEKDLECRLVRVPAPILLAGEAPGGSW